MPTNNEFLTALFGSDAPFAHVTDFQEDPNNVPSNRHLIAWRGNYFSRYSFTPPSNQYFTISTFAADDQGIARRRKALFRQTHVIVLDDVKEKLNLTEVERLPKPSWILESSEGSEQWGYILNKPCTNRHWVENLLDGLVTNGLAPEGRDPGMKGVTRYVRLPEGINNKASKLVNGQPFKCQITEWHPERKVDIQELASPFNVDLYAVRREARTDGAADIEDHPIIQIPDLIRIKDIRSDGRFDVTCPWVDEHTGQDDSGTAIFTNEDGTIGFKCHHGSCQNRTGKDLLEVIEEDMPGFGSQFSAWKMQRAFKNLGVEKTQPIQYPTESQPVIPDFSVPPPPTQSYPTESSSPVEAAIADLRKEPAFSEEARTRAAEILRIIDTLPTIEKQHWQNEIRDHMNWSKTDFKPILKDLQKQWYEESASKMDFFDDLIYIGELNQFMNRKKQIFYSVEAFQNTYSHIDEDARKKALISGRVDKVDRIDYAPKKPSIFTEDGIVYGNTWSDDEEVYGIEGDASPWLNHWDAIGWSEHRDHVMKWMAFTILYPEVKINHMLIMGSGEGCGKDFLLAPLVHAMGKHHETIPGESLLEDYNDYLLNTKYLNINETELGDRREAVAVANKLKPLAAAPPKHTRINTKHVKHVKVRNIVNSTMTTNSQLPVRVNGPSRRIYAMWSDLNTRDEFDNMLPEWVEYWKQHWEWMESGGADIVVHYLRNKVDLSQFNPGAPPKVTDFMRDIRESSKSPAQLTIEAFITAKKGLFYSDLITAKEMSNMLRMGEAVLPNEMYLQGKWFTPQKVSMVLKEMGFQCFRARRGDESARVWVIRNIEKYQALTDADLYTSYVTQMAESKNQQPMTVVNS